MIKKENHIIIHVVRSVYTKIELMEVERKQNELFFNVVDKDTNLEIGILFTIGNHVAYEIKPEFRGQGAATEAL